MNGYETIRQHRSAMVRALVGRQYNRSVCDTWDMDRLYPLVCADGFIGAIITVEGEVLGDDGDITATVETFEVVNDEYARRV